MLEHSCWCERRSISERTDNPVCSLFSYGVNRKKRWPWQEWVLHSRASRACPTQFLQTPPEWAPMQARSRHELPPSHTRSHGVHWDHADQPHSNPSVSATNTQSVNSFLESKQNSEDPASFSFDPGRQGYTTKSPPKLQGQPFKANFFVQAKIPSFGQLREFNSRGGAGLWRAFICHWLCLIFQWWCGGYHLDPTNKKN